MMTPSYRHLLGLFLFAASILPAAEPAPPPLKLRSVRASSVDGDFTAAKTIDGVISAPSRWTSRSSKDPSWLELDLGALHSLAGVHLYTGDGAGGAVRALKVQFWSDGQWVDIPSATVADNRAAALALAFDDTVAVRTDRLRLWITATSDGYAHIKEAIVWPAGLRTLPPLSAPGDTTPASSEIIPPIYLNQSGFNLGRPKRFTAPTLADGTPLAVRPAQGGAALFSGKLTGHIGDFSALDPADDPREFVVVTGPHTSVPFRIGLGWPERVTYQNAVNFMVDSRHYVGNSHPVSRGFFGWRDDHHFGWELHTLVPHWLSNPSAYARMPRQIAYEAPTDLALWGALAPYRAGHPRSRQTHPLGCRHRRHPAPRPRASQGPARLLPLCLAVAPRLPAGAKLRHRARLRLRHLFDLTLGYATKVRCRVVDFQLQVDNLRNQTYYTGNRVYSAPREFTLSATTKS